jgi:pyridoxal phosphate enzyme (YggS family)
MSIASNLSLIRQQLSDSECTLIAVSKTYPESTILEAYNSGQRVFGENKVQELVAKYEQLPKDIEWHLIGHLQSNKVKYIAPFVHLIHSVDSWKLLKEINKEGNKNNRILNVLLQIYIAEEETKFGLNFDEAEALLKSEELTTLEHIRIVGFMGMATNTEDLQKIRTEFRSLKTFFEKCRQNYSTSNIALQEVSMGMSSDYLIAVEEGSTMIRVGSLIFGNRNYTPK